MIRSSALALGLLAACVPLAVVAGDVPAASSSSHARVATQVRQLHDQVVHQQAQTQALRLRLDALQKQQQADRRHLQHSDQAISRLRKAIEQLPAGPDEH